MREPTVQELMKRAAEPVLRAVPERRSVYLGYDPEITDDELACSIIRLSEVGGSHRQWNANPPDLDVPYDPEADAVCDASEGDFLLGLSFLVPRQVDGALALDIPVQGETPAFVRLELPR